MEYATEGLSDFQKPYNGWTHSKTHSQNTTTHAYPPETTNEYRWKRLKLQFFVVLLLAFQVTLLWSWASARAKESAQKIPNRVPFSIWNVISVANQLSQMLLPLNFGNMGTWHHSLFYQYQKLQPPNRITTVVALVVRELSCLCESCSSGPGVQVMTFCTTWY